MRAAHDHGDSAVRAEEGAPAGRPPGAGAHAQPRLLEVRELAKSYGGTRALAGASLSVAPGSIHAIVGQNGAGKSTLMKCLAGAERPDGGEIVLGGEVVQLDSPRAARARGIGIVYQELSLLPTRSVLANLFVNAEPTRRGFVSRAAMLERAKPVLERVGLDVDLERPISELPIALRQLVEIARALLEEPRVLILDEPNSALNVAETDRLFGTLRELRDGGVTMLYVSHRLEEVFAISDDITVIRDGHDVATGPSAELDIAGIVQAMLGRAMPSVARPPATPRAAASAPALRTERLDEDGLLSGVSFDVAPGELVGLAGLEGSGVARIFDLLYGLARPKGGEATFFDGRGLPAGPPQAARRGIGFVAADRRHAGLMLDRSIALNLAHVTTGALPRGLSDLWVSPRTLDRRAADVIGDLGIKARGPQGLAGELSGGNQQKVVLGKWLAARPRLLMLADPTRGVDIGAKDEIYGLLRRLADDGCAVLFTSSELSELLRFSDRVLVMYRGALVGERDPAATSEHALLEAINLGT